MYNTCVIQSFPRDGLLRIQLERNVAKFFTFVLRNPYYAYVTVFFLDPLNLILRVWFLGYRPEKQPFLGFSCFNVEVMLNSNMAKVLDTTKLNQIYPIFPDHFQLSEMVTISSSITVCKIWSDREGVKFSIVFYFSFPNIRRPAFVIESWRESLVISRLTTANFHIKVFL